MREHVSQLHYAHVYVNRVAIKYVYTKVIFTPGIINYFPAEITKTKLKRADKQAIAEFNLRKKTEAMAISNIRTCNDCNSE